MRMLAQGLLDDILCQEVPLSREQVQARDPQGSVGNTDRRGADLAEGDPGGPEVPGGETQGRM